MDSRTLLAGGVLVSRFVLALIFAVSAAGKIAAPGLFRTMVEEYHMLPQGLITPFAYGLPWIEALLAVYLFLGLFLRFAGMATSVLLLIFIVALSVQIGRGNVAHGCGCLPAGGPLSSLPMVQWLAGGSTIGLFDIVRDLIFVGLAILIAVGNHNILSLDGWRKGGSDSVGDDEMVDEGGVEHIPLLKGDKV